MMSRFANNVNLKKLKDPNRDGSFQKEVLIIFDIENTRVPIGVPAEAVLRAVLDAFQTLSRRRLASFVTALSPASQAAMSSDRNMGRAGMEALYRLTKAIMAPGGQKSMSTDVKLITEINDFVTRQSGAGKAAHSVLVVITGDDDFTKPIQSALDAGMDVEVLHPPSPSTSQSLLRLLDAAHNAWHHDWLEFLDFWLRVPGSTLRLPDRLEMLSNGGPSGNVGLRSAQPAAGHKRAYDGAGGPGDASCSYWGAAPGAAAQPGGFVLQPLVANGQDPGGQPYLRARPTGYGAQPKPNPQPEPQQRQQAPKDLARPATEPAAAGSQPEQDPDRDRSQQQQPQPQHQQKQQPQPRPQQPLQQQPQQQQPQNPPQHTVKASFKLEGTSLVKSYSDPAAALEVVIKWLLQHQLENSKWFKTLLAIASKTGCTLAVGSGPQDTGVVTISCCTAAETSAAKRSVQRTRDLVRSAIATRLLAVPDLVYGGGGDLQARHSPAHWPTPFLQHLRGAWPSSRLEVAQLRTFLELWCVEVDSLNETGSGGSRAGAADSSAGGSGSGGGGTWRDLVVIAGRPAGHSDLLRLVNLVLMVEAELGLEPSTLPADGVIMSGAAAADDSSSRAAKRRKQQSSNKGAGDSGNGGARLLVPVDSDEPLSLTAKAERLAVCRFLAKRFKVMELVQMAEERGFILDDDSGLDAMECAEAVVEMLPLW